MPGIRRPGDEGLQMASGTYRAVAVWLAVAAVGGTALAGLAVFALVRPTGPGAGMLAAIAAAAAATALGLWAAALRLRDLLERLERLRGDLMIAASRDEALPARWSEPAVDEAGRLGQAVARLVEQHRLQRAAPDAGLAAVVAAAAEGLVVVTETGLVSLVNGAALARFGERIAVGTSIYDVFHRTELAQAAATARARREPVTATLHTVFGEELEARVAEFGDAAGVILCLPAVPTPGAVEVRHDLGLHRCLPASADVTPETPLDRLPVTVLDVETTGIDTARDRVISVGAVRLEGGRILRHRTLDLLVNPGQPIPARATAIHGISTAMVAGAPSFADVLPDIGAFLSGTVVVGHCISFDLKMLEREAARAQARWELPKSLCTMRLAAALFSEDDDLSLEGLAERLNVSIQGRHTALGDALVTAEIYVRMLPLLADAGVARLGDALAFAEKPRRIVAQQRQAGW